jgi:hypothetical protein
MSLPVQPTFPAGLISPTESAASGIPVSLGSLLFNAVDDYGTFWTLSELDGWDGTAEADLDIIKRPRAFGSLASDATESHRILVAKGTIEVNTPGDLAPAIARLNAAASLTQTVLGVNEAGLIRHMAVQRQDKVIVTKINQFQAEFSLQLLAEDPRKFGDVVIAQTNLPASSGGVIYPVTYPITYTGVTTSGSIFLNNTGDTEAPAWFKVEGVIPAGGWSVTNATQGKRLAFASTLSLTAEEFITIDMDQREVLAQGQSARSGWIAQRGWFSLSPGLNEIAFTAVNFDPTAKLTIYTMSAWS